MTPQEDPLETFRRDLLGYLNIRYGDSLPEDVLPEILAQTLQLLATSGGPIEERRQRSRQAAENVVRSRYGEGLVAPPDRGGDSRTTPADRHRNEISNPPPAELERISRRLQAFIYWTLPFAIPPQDLEDIHQQTLLELVRSGRPLEEWVPLGQTIARRRSMDWCNRNGRSHSPLIDLDAPEPHSDIDDVETKDLVEESIRQLRELAATDPKNHLLVALVIEHILANGEMPSLRCIGAHPDLWPDRPQTACERWQHVTHRLRWPDLS